MKKQIITMLIILFSGLSATAQVGISATNTPPNASAMLDVSSTNKGVLIPRMNTAQKNAIPNKAEGLMVYDSDAKQFSYWTGTLWVNFGNSVSAGIGWSQSGNDLSNTNAGNVGIGVAIPKAKLEVNSGVNDNSGLRLSQIKAKPIPTKKYYSVTTPTGMTFDNDNNLYTTSIYENKIYKITPSGKITNLVTTGLNYPYAITLGPDNNLYVCDAGSNRIMKVTLSGVVSVFATGFNFPSGLTFDASGNLYVVNNDFVSYLSKVNSSGVVVNLNFGTGLKYAEGCVYNSVTNKIYVANVGDNEIAQFNVATGGVKTTFVSNFNGLNDIECDSQGNIYFTQNINNKIFKSTPSGIVSEYANAVTPAVLSFDNNNKLFIGSLDQILRQSINSKTILTVNEYGDIVPIESNSIVEDHFIGERFGGGIIFFLTADKKNGLIVASQNQYSTPYVAPTHDPLGEWLVSFSYLNNPAKHDADGKNFVDWRFPTMTELMLIGTSKVINANTVDTINRYWTSSVNPADPLYVSAYHIFENYGCSNINSCTYYHLKTNACNTRGVRSF
jgi:sugar lactone lactonase YvrE